MPKFTGPINCVVTLFDGETVALDGVTLIERQYDLAERDNRSGASSMTIVDPLPTGTLTIRHAGGTYETQLEYVTSVTYSR